jgi:adenosine deaminase
VWRWRRYVGPRTGDGVGASPYRAHPIAGWHRAGLSVALSCDNITLSGSRRISSSSQLVHLVIDCGLGWGAAREVLLNGVR